MTARDRDEKFRELFAGTYRLVFAYALRRTPDRADAEDVVSDAFLVAWRRLDSIPEDTHEQRLWMYGVARRSLSNQRRGADRAGRLALRVRQESSEAPPADTGLEDESDLGAALAAFGRLSETDQELVRLALWEELSHPDIAKVVGTPVANVSVRLHRAKRRLRTHFDDLVQDPAESGHVMVRRATGDQEQESTE